MLVGTRPGGMTRRWRPASALTMAVAVAGVLLGPRPGFTHPLGNFSINRYAAITVASDRIELRYLVDMAEIPTFQEIQEHGIAAEADHRTLPPYLARQAERLKEKLVVEVDGRRLALSAEATDILFTPGAGGLPTMKFGILYHGRLDGSASTGSRRLTYRDANFAGPGRVCSKQWRAAQRAGCLCRPSLQSRH